ncbi:hypothetical protein ACTL6P_05835 [Endozoicomonas acroporae]|uniref:hypothetical protein n=1 Tax=Endozoicomonas acroporae TaxID=1701104 RepID=UPI003F893774
MLKIIFYYQTLTRKTPQVIPVQCWLPLPPASYWFILELWFDSSMILVASHFGKHLN